MHLFSDPAEAPLTVPLTGAVAASCRKLSQGKEGPDSDLARVVEAWPALPEHIKAAILALVGTASG